MTHDELFKMVNEKIIADFDGMGDVPYHHRRRWAAMFRLIYLGKSPGWAPDPTIPTTTTQARKCFDLAMEKDPEPFKDTLATYLGMTSVDFQRMLDWEDPGEALGD